MVKKYLLLWLESPLQSWGEGSKFYRRNTLDFPTRAGVLGLILSGMGATGKQEHFLKNFLNLKQTVYSYKKKDLIDLYIPKLEDFQMVGSGYNKNDKWENLLIPKTSLGRASSGGGSKLIYKYYLQSSYFGVVMEIPSELEVSIERGLTKPFFNLYLGRKCCVPTDFIFNGIYQSPELAFKQCEKIANRKDLLMDFKVLDGVYEGRVKVLKDVPICFGLTKKYLERQVTIVDVHQ